MTNIVLIENSDKKLTIPELSQNDVKQLENYRSISDDTLGRILHQAERKSSFINRDLADISENDAKDLLTSCFIKKGAFVADCAQVEHKLRYEDFLHKMHMLWPMFLKHSFGILDHNSRLVAVGAQVDDFELRKNVKELQQTPTTQVSRYLVSHHARAQSRVSNTYCQQKR